MDRIAKLVIISLVTVLVFLLTIILVPSEPTEDTKLVQCIEHKFNNNEFKTVGRTYSFDYISGDLAIILIRKRSNNDYEFKNVTINGVVIILSGDEEDRIEELIEGSGERRQKNLRNKLYRETKPDSEELNITVNDKRT